MADDYRYYLIIKRPGWIPETKRPPHDTEKRLAFVKECLAHYPEAEIISVTVTPHDLWVETATDFVLQQEAWAEMARWEKSIAVGNRRILRTIRAKFGKKYRKDIMDCLKEGEAKHDLKIVTKPAGARQEENWRSFRHIFVNQTENGGMEGDSFSGTFAIPLPDGTYLETYYSM